MTRSATLSKRSSSRDGTATAGGRRRRPCSTASTGRQFLGPCDQRFAAGRGKEERALLVVPERLRDCLAEVHRNGEVLDVAGRLEQRQRAAAEERVVLQIAVNSHVVVLVPATESSRVGVPQVLPDEREGVGGHVGILVFEDDRPLRERRIIRPFQPASTFSSRAGRVAPLRAAKVAFRARSRLAVISSSLRSYSSASTGTGLRTASTVAPSKLPCSVTP